MQFSVSSLNSRVVITLVCASLFGAVACTEPPREKPQESVVLANAIKDGSLARRVSVSGVSAGGYMAVQTHVALADRVGGVAVIAVHWHRSMLIRKFFASRTVNGRTNYNERCRTIANRRVCRSPW